MISDGPKAAVDDLVDDLDRIRREIEAIEACEWRPLREEHATGRPVACFHNNMTKGERVMENENALGLPDEDFLAELMGGEPRPRISPSLKIRASDEPGKANYSYRDGDRWGVGVGDEDELYPITPADYDEVFPLGGSWFAARQEETWYLVRCDWEGYPPAGPYRPPYAPSSLEDAIRHLRTDSQEWWEYEAAQSAITADDIEYLGDEILLYRRGEQWGCGYRDNRFLTGDMVIPSSVTYGTREEALSVWARGNEETPSRVQPIHRWQAEGF